MTSHDQRIAELYELPPDEFTAARDRLTKELRESGEKGAANEVKKLRRPTVAAWALNHAARENLKLVDDLLEASDELRRVQSRGAGSAELKRASGARRRAVDPLAAAARGALGDAGHAHEDDITETLLAAATDDDVRRRLRAATLERAAAPTANFEDLGSLLAAAVGTTRPPPKKAGAEAKPEPEPPRADTRAVERARQRAERLDAEARDAEDEAERIEREARDGEREIERLRRELEAAERAAAEVRRRADRTRHKAETARSRADDAREALAELEVSSA